MQISGCSHLMVCIRMMVCVIFSLSFLSLCVYLPIFLFLLYHFCLSVSLFRNMFVSFYLSLSLATHLSLSFFLSFYIRDATAITSKWPYRVPCSLFYVLQRDILRRAVRSQFWHQQKHCHCLQLIARLQPRCLFNVGLSFAALRATLAYWGIL